MGIRFRKSINLGGARINISKSGIGGSIGGKGFRATAKAGGGTRTTANIPGTGLSYVSDSKNGGKKSVSAVPADEVAVNRVGSIVLLVCAIPLIVLGLLLALAVPALGLGFAGFGVALLFIRKAMKKRIKMLLGEDAAYEKSTNSDL